MLEFTSFRTTSNMKKAYKDYISNTHKFIEVAKSATSSELKDIRIDNSVFYLEYSKDSKIDITKITDGARGLGLTHGDLKCGRNIVKIGNSEVEIKTEKGKRNYTDLTEGSDVVLTFYTSLGELEVRLRPDIKNKSHIKVEVCNQDLLKQLKDCKEKIGENCLLGELSVNQAIEQGFFVRSGKLMRSETMSQSDGKIGPLTKLDEIRGASSFKETVSRCI